MKRMTMLAALLLLVGCHGSSAFPPVSVVEVAGSGYGGSTTGGAGGDTLRVFSPVALSAALAVNLPRVVVFGVGGVWDLSDYAIISRADCTLDGSTAPSPVCLRGGGIMVNADNVIIRNLAIRPGDGPAGPVYGDRDCIKIIRGVRVLLEHLSLSWSVDECLSMNEAAGSIDSVTVRHCMIAEALNDSYHPAGEHGYGVLIAGGVGHVSLFQNVLAFHKRRNPRVAGGSVVDLVGNAIVDWGDFGTHGNPLLSASVVNIAHNHYATGPDFAGPFLNLQSFADSSEVYVEFNTGDDPDLVAFNANRDGFVAAVDILVDEPAVPIFDPPSPLTISEVLGSAGAPADLVDDRIRGNIEYGGGQIINSQGEVGGYAVYSQ
jgi:hypothetical protein